MKDLTLKIGGKEISSLKTMVIENDCLDYLVIDDVKHIILRTEFKKGNVIVFFLGGCDIIVRTDEAEYKRLKAMLK